MQNVNGGHAFGSIDGTSPMPDGNHKRRSLAVGSLDQYPNEATAKRAVASLLVNIYAESPRFNLEPIIVQTLVEHYQDKELGDDSNKTFATCETYKVVSGSGFCRGGGTTA